jgi:radical SAM superfamily enzyme YgiQ (UPF0313 family)
LKKFGHETFLIFDPRQFNRAYAQNKLFSKIFDIKKENIQKLVNFNPDLICFSVLTANYQWALEMAGLIKKEIKAPIIFGGIHPTSLPETTLKNKQVDMVCIGEGELALVELADKLKNTEYLDIKNIWFKKNGKIIKNNLRPPISNLDILPFPDKEMFYEQLPPSYQKNSSIITSRGCYFGCSYCCNSIYHKLYKGNVFFRRRSVGNVIEELLKMKKVFKSEYIFFSDDLFGTDEKWLKDFCLEYKKKIKLPYSCLSHPSFINENTVSLLANSGCHLLKLGLQTGNENFRNTVFKRYETNESIVKVADACNKKGLKYSIDHILNAPGDSDQIELESANLYNQIRPNLINCYGLLYFPTTEIVKTAKKKGLLGKNAEKLINEGKASLYPSAILTAKGENLQGYYRKYSFLLTMIPLFPKAIMNQIINHESLRKIILFLPSPVIVLVKIILNYRIGLGLLPVSILKNELFYFVRFFKTKVNSYIFIKK